jgi:rhodanese-related sulfurtransferase
MSQTHAILVALVMITGVILFAESGAPRSPAPSTASAPVAKQAVSLADLLALKRLGGLVLIDARAPAAFQRAHLQGAINVPVGSELKVGSPVHAKLVAASALVVYCDNSQCGASLSLVARLEKIGIDNAAIYAGGLNEWLAAGLEVEHGT